MNHAREDTGRDDYNEATSPEPSGSLSGAHLLAADHDGNGARLHV
jgi:hypothetical protein